MANLNIAIKLSAQDKASQAIGKITRSLGGLGSVAAGVATGGLALAAGAVVGLGAGLAAVTVGGIKSAATLDQQMSDIAAVMNKTKDEVGPLKDLIFDLSLDPQLKVSADEASSAIEMLARNGLEMEDILDGAAKGTVALANATGAEFGTAANVATDVMALFNIEAQDMEKAIDGITGVTTNSKFTIEDYAEGLANAGGIASGMGVELDDLNTVLAASSASFSSGAEAGSSMKTMLQRFGANSTAQKELSNLGISIFDTSGKMRSMADITGDLNNAFSTMTEEQAAASAKLLGGAFGSRTILELAKLTTEEFKELSLTINDQGQAAIAAATRVDSLMGAWEIFRSITSAISIQIGDQLLPFLRTMTEHFAVLATTVGPQMVDFFGMVGEKLSFLAGQGETAFVLMRQLFAGESFSGDLLVANFGAIGEILRFVTESARRLIDAFNTNGLSGVFIEFKTILSEAWTGTIQPTLTTWATDFWAWLVGGEGSALSQAGGMVGSLIATVSGLFISNWPIIAAALQEWSNKFWDWLLSENGAIARTSEALNTLLGKIGEWVTTHQGDLSQLGYTIGTAMADGIKLLMESQQKVVGVLMALGNTLNSAIPILVPGLINFGKALGAGILQGIWDEITSSGPSGLLNAVSSITPGGIVGDVAMSVLGFAEGGVVPGPAGSPQMVMAHGGEMILNQQQQQGLGGTSINVTVNANDEAGGQRAGTAFVSALRQQGIMV
ncbi:MAG: phage tail tape measure protein [Chloroflexi bacterium]|nr:phage tail tape measure protein [Chloroflexota bacterium]